LLGAFLAGVVVVCLPTMGNEQEAAASIQESWELYCKDIQDFILEPLFFASIGFAIPFLELWTGTITWYGITYTLLMLIGKAVVGLSIVLWTLMGRDSKDVADTSDDPDGTTMASLPLPTNPRQTRPTIKLSRLTKVKNVVPSAVLLGMAMVARGEIGLLIIQIGYNETSFVSRESFMTGIWAILLNTIVGPIAVGVVVRLNGEAIGKGPWGLVKAKPMM
jgi:Kef-type K+ transport system membrane component KefB